MILTCQRWSSPVKDGADPGTVSAVPMDVESRGEQDPVFHRYGPMGEGGDKKFIPAWRKDDSGFHNLGGPRMVCKRAWGGGFGGGSPPPQPGSQTREPTSEQRKLSLGKGKPVKCWGHILNGGP